MKPSLILLAAFIALSVTTQARATIQDDMLCIDPAIEFPVPCGEDE